MELEEIHRLLALMHFFVCTILISWFVFVALGYPPLDALFEVVSATATLGLSTGITHNDLPLALKLTLCMDMLLGCLEIVANLVLLYHRTWIGRRVETA